MVSGKARLAAFRSPVQVSPRRRTFVTYENKIQRLNTLLLVLGGIYNLSQSISTEDIFRNILAMKAPRIALILRLTESSLHHCL